MVDVTKVRGNRFTTSEGTFRFDRNDNYATGAEGERITYAQFRRQLSVGDSVQVFRYCTRTGGKSGFALFNDAGSTPPKGCRSNDAPLVDVTKVRGNRFTTSEGTFRFDRNDEFNVGAEGDRISYAQFKRNLSVGDSVQVFRYCTRPAGASSFALFQ